MKASATILACCCAAAGLIWAASGLGAGSAPSATSISASYDGVRVLHRDELVGVSPERARHAAAKVSAKSAKLSYFTTVNVETVVPGGDQLYEFRCPAKRQPVTGGALTTTPGLAISNSSRISPDPDRPTLSGAWYEGVVNLTATALTWKPFLVCVRS